MRLKFFGLAVLLCAGCASSTKQTDDFLAKPTALPVSAHINDVPFIDQQVGHCGPATLAMAMNWSGKNISVEEIAPQVFTPGAKGSFQTDMISASRRNGMFAVTIDGVENLLTEISAGNPVIVFENLALSWAPQWHYALVFGYDLKEQKVIMHSGPEQNKSWDMRVFERSWKLGDYWGLVVLPPGKLSATASELSQTKAASGLEQLGKLPEAQKSFEAILLKWPESLGAYVGLANFQFAQKKPAEAAKTLKTALKFHADAAPIWHNLAIAQGTIPDRKAAKTSAKRALSLANPEQKAQYQQSLGQWLAP